MARTRSLKPEFFQNDQLAPLAFEWRLLFAGLWTQADRDGRLEDRHLKIKAALFPYDDLNIDEGLGCLANANLIIRYEVNGTRYIAIPTFHKHQNPHSDEKPKHFPAPPAQGEHRASPVLAPCLPGVDPAITITGTDPVTDPNTTPARGAADTADERFERFWLAYPRKIGKEAARHVWKRLKPSDELTAQMVTAIGRQSQSPQWTRDGGQFIPHPRTWLHQGRWQDGPDVGTRAGAGQQSTGLVVKPASKFAHLTNRGIA